MDTNLTRNDSGIYTFQSGNRTIDMTWQELANLTSLYEKMKLRDRIGYALQDADGDTILIDRYPYSYEELVDELFVELEEIIDDGGVPSDDDIIERIHNTADFYEMLTE